MPTQQLCNFFDGIFLSVWAVCVSVRSISNKGSAIVEIARVVLVIHDLVTKDEQTNL